MPQIGCEGNGTHLRPKITEQLTLMSVPKQEKVKQLELQEIFQSGF